MNDVITIADLEAWLRQSAEDLDTNADWLTALDSAIGDADHGTNMTRGLTAIVTSLDSISFTTAQELLKSVGMTLISTVGGASGSLYGTFFLEMGKAVPAVTTLDGPQLEQAIRAGISGVVTRGHAAVGDKTMVDAFEPAVAAFSLSLARGLPIADASAAAAKAAADGRDSTESLVARKGRASYLGDRSTGHIDPGSASATILLQSLSDVLGRKSA
ncbi:dihydroxyacetone kinase subunit DhaL [Microbacterium sp. A196]|uniref:dihydroxyacetone kinase subunit DhaL n=1 Tax=Microbacterium sp. A196 TaxID=3457320 RepID=UPI003FD5A2FC